MFNEVWKSPFLSLPSSLGFMVHMSGCGQGRCPRLWWIWLGAWRSGGAWETLGQRRSRDQNRTATRSGREGWTWTFCIQWKTSVRSAAPLTAAREVRKKLSCRYQWFWSCFTSPDDLDDCCRCQRAGSVPCTDCHGVVEGEDGVRERSTAAQDQKPLGKMLLGRGLDRKVGMYVPLCVSWLRFPPCGLVDWSANHNKVWNLNAPVVYKCREVETLGFIPSLHSLKVPLSLQWCRLEFCWPCFCFGPTSQGGRGRVLVGWDRIPVPVWWCHSGLPHQWWGAPKEHLYW